MPANALGYKQRSNRKKNKKQPESSDYFTQPEILLKIEPHYHLVHQLLQFYYKKVCFQHVQYPFYTFYYFLHLSNNNVIKHIVIFATDKN